MQQSRIRAPLDNPPRSGAGLCAAFGSDAAPSPDLQSEIVPIIGHLHICGESAANLLLEVEQADSFRVRRCTIRLVAPALLQDCPSLTLPASGRKRSQAGEGRVGAAARALRARGKKRSGARL